MGIRKPAQKTIDTLRRRVGLDGSTTGMYKTITTADHLRRAPSYLRGAIAQTLQTLKPTHVFQKRGKPAVMLVPGLFCSPSAMNRLGLAMQDLGADVYLPRRFPDERAMIPGVGCIDASARSLVEDLQRLRAERGVEHITLGAHSMGGIIVLRMLEQAERSGASIPKVRSVVTMGTPFRGSKKAVLVARAFKGAHQAMPASPWLRDVEYLWPRVTRALVAGADFVVDESSQRPDDVPSILLPGFQHMDFIVGSPERVQTTAALIAQTLG